MKKNSGKRKMSVKMDYLENFTGIRKISNGKRRCGYLK